MSSRKPRADAMRNREHIVEVARQVFAQEGGDVSMEDIVKRSGLGVGTLYRHFSTRDALIEAVYLSEVEALSSAAASLADELPPVEALRQWMLLFVDFLATKHAMGGALNAMVGGTTEFYATSGELLRLAISSLVERAGSSGEVSLDIEPLDLLRALGGVAHSGAGRNGEENARRLVAVLIEGIRVPK